MADQPAEFENSQEFENLLSQGDRITKLLSLATGKVVLSQNSDEAKKTLSEWTFYYLADDHLELLIETAQQGSSQEELADYAVESQETFTKISQDGNWEEAKKKFWKLEGAIRVDSRYLRLDDAKRMGLNSNLKYKNTVNLFSAGQPNDFQSDAWEKLIREKLDLVPDKTAPYTHPHLEELKASIG